MSKQQSVDIDQKELKRAQEMWGGFTKLLKYSTIIIVVVLALMALGLVEW